MELKFIQKIEIVNNIYSENKLLSYGLIRFHVQICWLYRFVREGLGLCRLFLEKPWLYNTIELIKITLYSIIGHWKKINLLIPFTIFFYIFSLYLCVCVFAFCGFISGGFFCVFSFLVFWSIVGLIRLKLSMPILWFMTFLWIFFDPFWCNNRINPRQNRDTSIDLLQKVRLINQAQSPK